MDAMNVDIPEDVNTGLTPGERVEQIAAAVDPVPDAKTVQDYWSAPAPSLVWEFPDGIQWVSYRKLNHGQRSEYLARTNKEMVVERRSGDARIKADLAGDANILMEIAIDDWYVLRDGKPVGFSKGSKGSSLSQFLTQADPGLVDQLERAIRDANKWLLGERDLKAMYQEQEDLAKEIAEAEEREKGK